MKKLSVIIAVCMAVMLLASCTGGGGNSTPTPASGGDNPGVSDPSGGNASGLGTVGQAKYKDGYRVIRIVSVYKNAGYYVSDETLEDLPDAQLSPEAFQAKYDHMKAVEEKYKVKFERVRMTYDGVGLSLDEGVLSGMPEADVYESEVRVGIPSVLNNYVYALEDFVGADDDVFTKKEVFQALKVPGQDKTYMWRQNNPDLTVVYMLGFNWTLLKSKGLENPQTLWERGEWTWDKLIDYCAAVTDLNANPPVYGFSWAWEAGFDGLIRSNGVSLAASREGGFESQGFREVVDLVKKLYVDLKVARPWNTDDYWANDKYSDGSSGFFTMTDWISDESWGGGGENTPLPGLELGVVPWPVGPSGNQDTNYLNTLSGNVYIIPKGVEDPGLVFKATEDLFNWYDGDYENTKQYDVIPGTEPIPGWSEREYRSIAGGNQELADKNVELMFMANAKASFDPWASLGVKNAEGNAFTIQPVMLGEEDPSQWIESLKQPFSDALAKFYG